MTALLHATEADFMDAVDELAQLTGWKVCHYRPARTKDGWRTPAQYDGKGFPDLVMARPPRVLIVELKSARGRVTPEQREWLDTFAQCPGVESYTWRPSDWWQIEQTLARPPEQLTITTTNSTAAGYRQTMKDEGQ